MSLSRPAIPQAEDLPPVDILDTIGSAFARRLAESIGISFTRQAIYVCTSISSTIVSLISSIYLISTKGAGSYFVFSIPIITSLTSLVCQIASLVELSNAFSFDRERAMATVTNAARIFAEMYAEAADNPANGHANGIDTPSLVRYGIQIASMVLTAGMIKYNFTISDINAFLTLREKNARASTEATEFITDVLADFGWADLDGRLARFAEYQSLTTRSLEMLRIDPAQYVIEPGLYNQMLDVCNEIGDILMRKIDQSEVRRYQTIRTQLANNLAKLNEIRGAIAHLTDAQIRIATKGIIFEGAPGVGKSEFVNFFLKSVCSALTLPTAIYDLRLGASEKFFGVYTNQAAAVVNEYGASAANDILMRHINSIVSSDACSFESAFVKDQPCKLRIVAATSNRDNYDSLLSVLPEFSLIAMLTRFVRVKVSDPLFKGRMAANPHRKPDFSHLKFKLRTCRIPNFKNLNEYNDEVLEDITYEEIRSMMIKSCAEAELHYIANILASPAADCTDAQRAIFEARRAQLTAIMAGHEPIQATTSNSNANTRHCVIRLQGGIGRGKTTIIEKTIRTLSETYNLEVRYVRELSDLLNPSATEPYIYVMDDFPIHSYPQKYMDFSNTIHHHSVVLIGTNHVIECARPSYFGAFNIANAYRSSFAGYDPNGLFKPWSSSFIPRMMIMFLVYMFAYAPARSYHPTSHNMRCNIHETPGIVRRVGLDERLIEGTEPINLPPSTGLCFTSQYNGTFTTMNDEYYPDIIPSIIVNHYASYLRENTEFSFVQTEPPLFVPDVTITIRDFALWKEKVRTEDGYVSMYLNDDDTAGRVEVKPDFINSFLTKTSIKYWIMNISELADLDAAIKTLCNTLRNALPDINVLVSHAEKSYALCNRTAYTWGTFQRVQDIYVADGAVWYKGAVVPPAAIMRFIHAPHSSDILVDFPFWNAADLAVLKRWFKSNSDWRAFPCYEAANSTMLEGIAKLEKVKDHPIISCYKVTSILRGILDALLSIFLVGSMVFGIYNFIRWLTKPKSGNTKANEDLQSNNDKYDERNSKYQEEYARGVEKGLYKNPADYAAVLYHRTGDQSVARSWELYDTDLRANSTPTFSLQNLAEALKSGNETYARIVYAQVAKKGLDWEDCVNTFKISSNAVNTASEHTPDNSIIANVMNKMRRAVCQVLKVDGSPACYGIFYGGKRFVTVGHCFDHSNLKVHIRFTPEYGTACSVYPAKILAINRDKDLAICEVLDASFPAQPDLQKMLPQHTDTYQWCGPCYYLRPTQNGYIFQGYSTRHAYTSTRRSDMFNKNYSPATWYTFNYSQLLNVADIFKGGDCGFPLISIENNKPVLLGIHNGYDGTGTGYFSPLTITDLVVGLGTHSNALPADESILAPGKLNIPNYNGLLGDGIQQDKLWTSVHNKLDVIGRVPKLHYYTNPATKKRDYHDDGHLFPNPSLPSPITNRHLSEAAIVKLPKDSHYKASPLMAQALKFGEAKPISIDADIYNHAVQIQHDMYRFLFPQLHVLRPAQAINGLMDGPMKAVVMDTSPGPYLKKVYGITNKKDLFVNINEGKDKPAWYVYSNHPAARDLSQQADDLYNAWAGGSKVHIIIKDNAKVELLPRDEVRDNGKIRLFCEMDLCVNLVIRRLTGDFISNMQENHQFMNCKNGVNFYRDLHWYAKSFPRGGLPYGFDVRRMDKNLPAFLIRNFFQLIYNLLDPKHQNGAGFAYDAAARDISNAIHILEGLLYRTIRGNPSGIACTNPLNTISLELIMIYNHIKTTLAIGRPIKSHTSATYYVEVKGFYNGDNGYVVITHEHGYTQETIQASFNDFGLEILFDKSHLDGIEWCGRTIKYDKGFLIPALRREAILRQIYYVDPGKLNDLPNQFVVIQLEAALHDAEFYRNVQSDIMHTARKLQISMDKLHVMTYDNVRSHYIQYVCGEVDSPVLTAQAADYLSRNSNFNSFAPPEMSTNWISLYYERCAKERLPIQPNITYAQDSTTLKWLCTVTDQQYKGEGLGNRKPDARNEAFGVLYEHRFGHITISNADLSLPTMHKHSVRYTYHHDIDTDVRTLTIFSDATAVVSLVTKLTQEEVSNRLSQLLQCASTYLDAFAPPENVAAETVSNSGRDKKSHSGLCGCCEFDWEAPCAPRQNVSNKYLQPTGHPDVYRVRVEDMTPAERRLLDPDYDKLPSSRKPNTHSNSLVGTSDSAARNPNLSVTGAEDAVSQGFSNQGGMAPQPTSTLGTPQPPPQVLESTGGLAKVTNLNPFGATNQMNQGAIMFDLPALVYSQIIDTNSTYKVTDSMAVGTKVLEIPYDPLSEFMNPFVRQWVGMHERYNGDVIIRIQTLSNQLFSGAVVVFWYNESYPGEVISRPEAQKYSYQIMALTMPSTEYYILKDARQYQYYRSTRDPVGKDRPVLGIAVHLPLRNPQRDGIYADIVIGSRLCNQRDMAYGAIPFVASNPQLVSSLSPVPVTTLNGLTLGEIFPEFGVNYLQMCTDGTTTVPSYSLLTDGLENYFDLRACVPGIFGGNFSEDAQRRLFASTDLDSNNIMRGILVMGQYPQKFALSVAPLLQAVIKSDNFLELAKAASFITGNARVYCSRNNAAPLIISKTTASSATPQLTLLQQTTFLTNVGVIYVLVLEGQFGITSGSVVPYVGLMNTSQNLPLELPRNPVLGPVVTADELVPLPSGWKSLKFSRNFPPVVSTISETAPTIFTDASIINRFDILSASVGNKQALQFALLEPVAQTAVAFVRYLSAQREFVIYPNSASRYMLYPNNAADLVVSEYSIVRLDSGFPQSDVGDWSLRQPSGLQATKYYRYAMRGPQTTSNALLVPEAIADMDAAMDAMGDSIGEATATRPPVTTPVGAGSSSQYTNAYGKPWLSEAESGNKKWLTDEKMFDYVMFGILPQTTSNGSVITKPFEIINSDQQAAQNRMHENAMQQAGFGFQQGQQQRDEAFQTSMQTSDQAFRQQMQTSDQAFQRGMQQSQQSFQLGLDNTDYQHNSQLQANAFANSNQQLASNQAFQKQMEGTTFTHGLINTALGGAFGLADTAVGKIGDYFLEGEKYRDQSSLNQQSYANQSKLMTQNAALNIQAAGQSSQSMLLAQVH